MGPNDSDKSIEEQANENEVIDLRDGAGWEGNLAHEDYGDSND
jgi:hypothetical protein